MLYFLQVSNIGFSTRLKIIFIFNKIQHMFWRNFIIRHPIKNILKEEPGPMHSLDNFRYCYLLRQFWLYFYCEYLRFELIDSSFEDLVLFYFLVGCKSTFTTLETVALLTVGIIEDILKREIKLCALNTHEWFSLYFLCQCLMIFLTGIKINQRILLESDLTLKINLIILITQYNSNFRQNPIG